MKIDNFVHNQIIKSDNLSRNLMRKSTQILVHSIYEHELEICKMFIVSELLFS